MPSMSWHYSWVVSYKNRLFPLLKTIKIIPPVAPPVTGEDEPSTYENVLEIAMLAALNSADKPTMNNRLNMHP